MLFWLVMLLLVAAIAVGGFVGYRVYTTGETGISLGTWFAPKPEPRLGVSEQATVDSRRKLLLIRRDDVEHLIMTGGPVDVVIETGIAPPRTHGSASSSNTLEPPAAPVFTRPPRNFGQAVNE